MPCLIVPSLPIIGHRHIATVPIITRSPSSPSPRHQARPGVQSAATQHTHHQPSRACQLLTARY
ncbi:hypothetical protein E2C01_092688 [Portunus trituberculatus]|uniref:Uncharacterized protein n=1 Tax=Portunus trituberculatus TaxID=210409 RepID=A0A5B7JS29_PORTR|nr:hypothetical protein [Portunus trituberculatus]